MSTKERSLWSLRMNSLQKRYVDLGQDFDSSSIILKPSLRVNTLKISESKFVARMEAKKVVLQKIPYVKSGYYYTAPFSMVSSEEYLLGFFYFQEVASMVPAEVLLSDLKSVDRVDDGPISILDLCSAPGSKTTQLAQLTNNSIPILALDSSAPRLKILNYNLERLGVSSVTTMRKDGKFVDDVSLKFDYILVDAPCSGNFCVEKDFFQKRSVLDFKNRSIEQKKLLSAAIKVLKPNGVLVYSTCSLEPEEDEMVIDWLLDTFEDLHLEKIISPIGDEGLIKVFNNELNPELSKTRRFWPHKTGTEGFFIAKIRNTPSNDY